MDQTRPLSRREALRTRRRRTTLTVPEHVSPHVRLVFEEMKRQGRTYDDVEEASGVRRATLKAWRHKNRPGLESIEAVLGFLGFDYVPIPRERILPAVLVEALKPVAADHGLSMAATIEALIELVARIHDRADGAPATAPGLAEIAAPLVHFVTRIRP